jgi:SAM-dependent methyltransferase
MRVDAGALQRFYAGRLGQTVRRLVARRLEALWPDCAGRDLLGLGFATPYLGSYSAGARRTVALMPRAQGALVWPAPAQVASLLCDETRLPLLDSVFALEEAVHSQPLLREIWRVMAPEGRIIVIAANRAGFWSRSEATPFGHGRPFSRRQLAALLRDAVFEPTASALAAHVPPLDWGPSLAMADNLERAGDALDSPFGGLVMMEAVKRLYAAGAKEEKRAVYKTAHSSPSHLRCAQA